MQCVTYKLKLKICERLFLIIFNQILYREPPFLRSRYLRDLGSIHRV